MGKKIDSYNILLFIIIIIQLTLLFYQMDLKTSLSVDEIYTYSLSNSPNRMMFFPKIYNKTPSLDLQNRWLDNQVFKDYICVSENNRFNYSNVYDNQIQDTHPPLYYYLIHTICSFFPNSFSKWYGLSLNLIFFIIVQILLFRISKLILKSSKYALFVCIIYGYSLAAIDNFTYISTNSLITLFYLLLLNTVLKCFDNKISLLRFMELLLIVVLGGLSHYLFLLHSFVLVATFSFIVLKNRNFKLIAFVLGTTIFSFIFVYFLFPEMLYQIINSINNQEIILGVVNMIPNIGVFAYFIRKILGIPFPYYFYLGALGIIGFFALVITTFIKNNFEKSYHKYLILTSVSTLITTMVISFGINYNQTEINPLKYFLGFFPIISILIIAILANLNKRYLILIVVLLSFSLCTYKTNRFLFIFNKEEVSIEDIVKNKNLVLYFNKKINIQNFIILLSKCKNVFIYLNDEQNLLKNNIELPIENNFYLLTENNIILDKNCYHKIMLNSLFPNGIVLYEYEANNK